MRLQIGGLPDNLQAAFNYGLDKVRFITAVKVGARVRLRSTLVSLEDKGTGQYLMKSSNTIEIEGEEKPALIAETLAMLFERRARSREPDAWPKRRSEDRTLAEQIADEAAENTLALNPLIGWRAEDMVQAAGTVMKALAVLAAERCDAVDEFRHRVGQDRHRQFRADARPARPPLRRPGVEDQQSAQGAGAILHGLGQGGDRHGRQDRAGGQGCGPRAARHLDLRRRDGAVQQSGAQPDGDEDDARFGRQERGFRA